MTTLLVLGSGTATADSGKERTFLDCGVQLGGTELAYKPASAAARRGLNLRRELAQFNSTPYMQSSLHSSLQSSYATHLPRSSGRLQLPDSHHWNISSRLPAIMAIARVGCSWH